MKVLVALVVFIVLVKGAELRPGSGYRAARRYSSFKPTQSSVNSSNRCPTISLTIGSIIKETCKNGILYINDQEIKEAKLTDRIEFIANKLIINGKFIRHIPYTSPVNSKAQIMIGKNNNVSNTVGRNSNGCPVVKAKFACIGVSYSCRNGQFYINDEKISDVKSTDEVILHSNNLYVNRKFIRHFPPPQNTNRL
ncbi:hypothetical protein U1Q18_051013 [Sarracenia purpurea var. burkii]